jgi:hypothetical protein
VYEPEEAKEEEEEKRENIRRITISPLSPYHVICDNLFNSFPKDYRPANYSTEIACFSS